MLYYIIEATHQIRLILNIVLFCITLFAIFTTKGGGVLRTTLKFSFGVCGALLGGVLLGTAFGIGAYAGATLCILVFQIAWLFRMWNRIKNNKKTK